MRMKGMDDPVVGTSAETLVIFTQYFSGAASPYYMNFAPGEIAYRLGSVPPWHRVRQFLTGVPYRKSIMASGSTWSWKFLMVPCALRFIPALNPRATGIILTQFRIGPELKKTFPDFGSGHF